MIKKIKMLRKSFLLILLIQVMVLMFFGTKKCGMHMDEVCSYGLSNSNFKPFPLDFGSWLDKNYFLDYLSTGSDPFNYFNYVSVYYNQANDVHPPLYYFLLHTVCSFTPHIFSKWSGIILNIIIFILTNILLYLLSEKLLKNNFLSLCVCTLWGFSIGAISCVMFIRMYMLFTLWTVLYTLLFTKLINEDSDNHIKKKIYRYIGITTFLGCITHYYFLIFSFFVILLYGLYTLHTKSKWDFKHFFLTISKAFLGFVIFFPFSIFHIFLGYNGKNSAQSFFDFQNIKEIFNNYLTMVENLTFNSITMITLLTIVIIITLYCLKKIGNSKLKNYLFVIIPSICYFLLIQKITPIKADRYIFPIFPFLILAFVIGIQYILENFLNKKTLNFLFAVFTFVILFFNFSNKKVNYLYEDYQKATNISTSLKESKCIVFTDQDWKIIGSVPDLKNYSSVYLFNLSEQSIDSIKEVIPKNEDIVIYISDSAEENQILNSIKENSDLHNITPIYNSQYLTAYHAKSN